jgi:hypothetical protein
MLWAEMIFTLYRVPRKRGDPAYVRLPLPPKTIRFIGMGARFQASLFGPPKRGLFLAPPFGIVGFYFTVLRCRW